MCCVNQQREADIGRGRATALHPNSPPTTCWRVRVMRNKVPIVLTNTEKPILFCTRNDSACGVADVINATHVDISQILHFRRYLLHVTLIKIVNPRIAIPEIFEPRDESPHHSQIINGACATMPHRLAGYTTEDIGSFPDRWSAAVRVESSV